MKYILTFKPLKNFFFGNDKTFSDDYLAISECFPQNTQLLGALRLFIAEQNKLMHVHKNGKYSNEPEKLKKLVGTASAKDFSTNTDLGKINNLSQMFIVHADMDDAYFPTPFDIEIDADITYYELSNIDNTYFLKNYDVKKSSSQRLANKNFWNCYIDKKSLHLKDTKKFEEIFISHTQVGIGLDNKKTIEGKFYSKIDYNLEKDFLLACLIDIEENIIGDGIVQVGAEGSLFEVKSIAYENTGLTDHPIVSQLFDLPKKGDKTVALSDIVLESTDAFHSYFTIVPFFKNFAMINNDYEKFIGKTAQKRVIPAGTVAYIKDEIMPGRHDLGAYAKMGYNQFITAKK